MSLGIKFSEPFKYCLFHILNYVILPKIFILNRRLYIGHIRLTHRHDQQPTYKNAACRNRDCQSNIASRKAPNGRTAENIIYYTSFCCSSIRSLPGSNVWLAVSVSTCCISTCWLLAMSVGQFKMSNIETTL